MPEVVCAGCGTVCDDVTVDFATLAVAPHCPLAERWFAAQTAAGPDAAAAGEALDLDTAVERVAAQLRESRRLLVRIAGATVETASAAIALAEVLGAVIDAGGGSPAVALRGASTATLGEIRDRARVVIVWHADPETHAPASARAAAAPVRRPHAGRRRRAGHGHRRARRRAPAAAAGRRGAHDVRRRAARRGAQRGVPARARRARGARAARAGAPAQRRTPRDDPAPRRLARRRRRARLADRLRRRRRPRLRPSRARRADRARRRAARGQRGDRGR